ncbi:MAG: hypothetical protein HQM13_14645 [SAR324 cluster bacterium]|nr:hypothetical protein [SAR324 cluster bacterium]
MMRTVTIICLLIGTIGLAGCSSYLEVGTQSSRWIDLKDYDRVLQYYDEELKESEHDRLLYLLDKGMVLQMAGKFEESKRFFFSADQLADELDAISLSTQAGAFLSNDEAIPYKGEDYEKVMINVFNAFNFIALNDYGSALIESRRAREKLEILQQYEGQQYREDAFVYYLSGMLYEARGEINDAYIDYKRVFRLNPQFFYLQQDLLRLSSKLGFTEDFEKWKSFYRSSDKIQPEEGSQNGELVVLYASGKSPKKLPHQSRASSLFVGYALAGGIGASVGGDFLVPVPRFEKRSFQIKKLKIWNEQKELAQSRELENLEEIGFQSLRDRLGREVARAVGRLLAKAKLQDEVRKKFGGMAGLLVGAGMIATQKADTRSWLTLPASMQVSKVSLNPGEHNLTLKFYDKMGMVLKEQKQNVIIKSRQKTFLIIRTTQ